MPATEDLPYSVNVWSEDELSIAAVLVTAANASLARAAYAVACLQHRDRTISLIGPGVVETRTPEPVLKMKRERGITTDPNRLKQHRVELV